MGRETKDYEDYSTHDLFTACVLGKDEKFKVELHEMININVKFARKRMIKFVKKNKVSQEYLKDK